MPTAGNLPAGGAIKRRKQLQHLSTISDGDRRDHLLYGYSVRNFARARAMGLLAARDLGAIAPLAEVNSLGRVVTRSGERKPVANSEAPAQKCVERGAALDEARVEYNAEIVPAVQPHAELHNDCERSEPAG